MSDVITGVLSSLLTGKAINELFTGSNILREHLSLGRLRIGINTSLL